jgi:dGTP triphosphohydrolase
VASLNGTTTSDLLSGESTEADLIFGFEGNDSTNRILIKLSKKSRLKGKNNLTFGYACFY